MSNSPYPELKALSDEERNKLKYKLCDELTNYSESIYNSSLHDGLFLELLNDMSSVIDRIKQLVLTRGKE